MKWLRDLREKRKEAKKQKMLNKIGEILWKIKNEKNHGLLRKYLCEFPEVISLQTQTAGMAGTWVTAAMSDSFTVEAHDLFEGDTLVEAGNMIFDRLVEKHDL